MIQQIATSHPCFARIKPSLSQLYVTGDTTLLDKPKIAIVGSRKATQYTKTLTYEMAKALQARGVVVVSGAAMGVDAMAHKGAFPHTIAVMGNGLDLMVPKVNAPLIANLQSQALTISEYAPGTHATKYSFVQRNRIVVGMSDALIVSQADEQSGTMRSVEYALEYGVPIYVLVHNVLESRGSMKLLEEGKAHPIYSVEHLLTSLDLISESVQNDNSLEAYCATGPSYEEAVARFGQELFEYELLGKVVVQQGRVHLA